MEDTKSSGTHTSPSSQVQHTTQPIPHGTDRSKMLTLLVSLSLIIGLFSLYGIFSLHSKLNNVTGNAVAVPTGGDTNVPSGNLPSQNLPTKVAVSADDDPVLGKSNAPVTIVEFSDFECPFCGRHFSQTHPDIVKNYIDTGKVKLVYRDFPLSFHPNAEKAAEAAECANEQGKFWEMHDKLFSNQQSLSVANYKQWAKDLKLDSAKFDSCLDSGKYASEIAKDEADGTKYGVSGTPSFFIDGQLLVGAQPYSAFQQAIDAALAAKGK